MKRTTLIGCAMGAFLMVAGGCQSTHHVQVIDDSIALGMFSPTITADSPAEPGVFFLGAGDALGQAVFANYVAIVRAEIEWRYATGELIDYR